MVVKSEHQLVHTKPAVYGRVELMKRVRPARTRWMRSGCHGEYKCAINKPARYRTRTKRVMLQPRQAWVETRPAAREIVHQQVMVSPGTSHWVPVAHAGHRYRYHQAVLQPVQYTPAPGYVAPQPMPPYGPLKWAVFKRISVAPSRARRTLRDSQDRHA